MIRRKFQRSNLKTFKVTFPTTLGLNAFRGFLNEFMQEQTKRKTSQKKSSMLQVRGLLLVTQHSGRIMHMAAVNNLFTAFSLVYSYRSLPLSFTL